LHVPTPGWFPHISSVQIGCQYTKILQELSIYINFSETSSRGCYSVFLQLKHAQLHQTERDISL